MVPWRGTVQFVIIATEYFFAGFHISQRCHSWNQTKSGTNVWIMSFGQVVEFWNWSQMFIYFFVFCLIEKKQKLLCKFFKWNHPTFPISWKGSKIHFTTTLKKNTTMKIFWYSTLNALSKWHHPQPKSKFIWCIWIKIMVAFMSQTGHIIFCWNVLIGNIDNWSQTSFRVFTQHVHYFVSICFPTNFKGQLISKCPFGVFKSSKKKHKLFLRIFALASKKRSY